MFSCETSSIIFIYPIPIFLGTPIINDNYAFITNHVEYLNLLLSNAFNTDLYKREQTSKEIVACRFKGGEK